MIDFIFPAFFWPKLLRSRGAKRLAEGWAAVAEGQTQPPLAAQGRANSELRQPAPIGAPVRQPTGVHSPTRAKRVGSPKIPSLFFLYLKK
ncbi:hypothetical protein SGRA_2811 [Saprospira grandis str. Lewin]|uniref:Uncharacterized protein n=1 Tax=Saprospira grandis (strain Lewin) TaxID=984262 RepID=H6LA71_SAPGL|nr:hypothetical protein SGRA_2811 [Saprospira grandis str. Lewin]